MKKLGIVTLDSLWNYGNRLQNYALQKFLENYADQVDTLWHSPIDKFSIDMKKWPIQRRVRYAFMGNRVEKRINQCIRSSIRTYQFQQFTQQYICTKYEYGNLKRSNAGGVYDYLITGSDQVWNPGIFTSEDDVFLLFAPKEKRISYAASFGVPEIPENRKKHFSQWLMEMKAISVREQRGAEIVKELTGRTVPVVIDPTMLLSTEEWDEIACAPYWWLNQKECKGYVLLYFLGKMPTQIRNNVQKISKEKNLMIVNLMDENNMWYLTSPAEFLYLVAHAELVYTDSFHATVFSILYHTPFITCKKYEKTPKDNMHSRLVTLLERFQYADRLVTEEDNYILSNPFEMNFANVDHILEKERHKSACFLTKALSTNKT